MAGRRDELADLGTAFDLMASRLRVLMQSQTHLLHQVSHELRSPLARLQIAVGLARQQPDKIESSLQRIERESNRMDALVGELLELSRLESGVIQMDIEPLDVNELLETIVEDARFEGAAKEIQIEYTFSNSEQNIMPASLQIHGQQDLLHRAIDNVVRNALKYSPAKSVIHISCSMKIVNKVSALNIQVRDQGPGVAHGELNAIFDAFFRGSKTNEAVGHGVGLAIAKQVIEAHGGNITACNQEGGGLVVEINLPT
jgi:signal transduction histidine kinase